MVILESPSLNSPSIGSGDKLHVDNIKLEEELEQQKLNLRDINEFLTNELKARSLTTSAMEAKVMELYHQLDDIQKKHEETMGKLRRDAERQIEALEGHIKDYEKKARSAQVGLIRVDLNVPTSNRLTRHALLFLLPRNSSRGRITSRVSSLTSRRPWTRGSRITSSC